MKDEPKTPPQKQDNAAESELSASACSTGCAVAMEVAVNGVQYVAVGMENTRKAIALCGLAGAEDKDESWANAREIARLWNQEFF